MLEPKRQAMKTVRGSHEEQGMITMSTHSSAQDPKLYLGESSA